MDLTAFRNDLHRLVDTLIDKHLNADAEHSTDLTITLIDGDAGPYDYAFPNHTEHYDRSARYEVAGKRGRAAVRVARATRVAWGHERGRVVVFGKPEGLSTDYPWVEFVGTDDGKYAAKLIDPTEPRRSLRNRDEVPARFAHADVRRNDELFRSIRSGPALRIVVAADDEQAMIDYGYLVASQRGHI